MDQGVDETLIQSINKTFCLNYAQTEILLFQRIRTSVLVWKMSIDIIMTKNIKSIISKGQLRTQLECSICYEIFKEPRELPCGHSFCTACLERLASFGNSEFVDCPSCRNRHKRPPNGFRIDFKANKLLELLNEVNLPNLYMRFWLKFEFFFS